MTFPPPPPDRMHLQYQPAPAPQSQPRQMGPGGAYGPMRHSPDQPVPGQLPPPSMSMRKPGTITGIQVILWIFLALSTLGNLFSVINMVNYFNPIQLVVLAFTVYSAAQALISPVQIARGKRWAWIWSLVSAILGLVMSAAAIVFGIIMIDFAVYLLLVGVALAGLYGTFLGLLCSKSARQWILMHRVQRGEVPLPGMAAGGMAGPGGMAQAGPPQRPETKPGTVNFALVVLGLLAVATAWALYGAVNSLIALNEAEVPLHLGYLLFGFGSFPLMLAIMTAAPILVCALSVMFGLYKGRMGARVFTIVWASVLVLPWGFVLVNGAVEYVRHIDLVPSPARGPWTVSVIRDVVVLVLLVLVFIAMLLPGVRAWTPGKGPSALVVMVPMGQQGAQPGPYGGQQGGYTQQGGHPQQPPQPGGYSPQPPGQQSPYGGY
jgi:hypothetical protein